MKDIAYWLVFVVLVIGGIGFIRGLINPEKFNKHKPAPSRKRLAGGLVALVLIAGSFMAVLEPASMKQARLDKNNSAASQTTQQNQNNQQEIKLVEEKSADAVEVKTESQTESVGYESQNQNDSTLASGTSKVAVQGVNGERTIVYKVTYTNGVETARERLSDSVTKQPVAQITKVGTKVATPAPAPKAKSCSSGYYLNTAGNCVQSPGSSSPGATAKCRDGSYSYSQSRRGTCSHHGGVAQWL